MNLTGLYLEKTALSARKAVGAGLKRLQDVLIPSADTKEYLHAGRLGIRVMLPKNLSTKQFAGTNLKEIAMLQKVAPKGKKISLNTLLSRSIKERGL